MTERGEVLVHIAKYDVAREPVECAIAQTAEPRGVGRQRQPKWGDVAARQAEYADVEQRPRQPVAFADDLRGRYGRVAKQCIRGEIGQDRFQIADIAGRGPGENVFEVELY